MTNNFLLNNLNLDYDYQILILLCLILGCSITYLLISKYTSIPSKNIEALTNEEIETIINEITVPVSNANIDNFITDSESDTEDNSDIQSWFNSDSDSDTDSAAESILNDPALFFMPNVDFDVCPIEELKFFEWKSIYAREIYEHSISDEEIMEFISFYSEEELTSNWINGVFVYLICLL
jgi:hypothetical protein